MVEINKKVTAAQVIKSQYIGASAVIKGRKYIGTQYFFISEDLAPKGYMNRISNLKEIKELQGNNFEYLTDFDYYNFSEEEIEAELNMKWVEFKTNKGIIGMNYTYYSYFKKLGFELRFRGCVEPIGMFKDDEFVGIVLPVRIHK